MMHPALNGILGKFTSPELEAAMFKLGIAVAERDLKRSERERQVLERRYPDK